MDQRNELRVLARKLKQQEGYPYKSQFVALAGRHYGDQLDAELTDEVWHELWNKELVIMPTAGVATKVDEEASVIDRADQLEFEFKAEAIARKRVRDRNAEEALSKLPDVLDFEELEKASKDVPKYRISNLLPDNGNATVVGGNKCGKTERALELVKSLVTGEAYLGEFEVVAPLDGNVLFMNYEVTPATLFEWMSDMGLDSDKVRTMHLRDYAQVPLLSDPGAEWLVNVCLMHDVQTLVLDPGGRAMTAAGCQNEDSNDDVKVITAKLDQIKAEAGMSHLIIPLHANRVTLPVRPRGADSWGGWHDSTISLWLKDARKPYGPRMFSAHGRDVSMPDTELIRDEETRSCTLKQRGAPTEDDIADAKEPRRRKKGRAPVTDDVLDKRVTDYLQIRPQATKNEVQEEVIGQRDRLGEAYDRVKGGVR